MPAPAEQARLGHGLGARVSAIRLLSSPGRDPAKSGISALIADGQMVGNGSYLLGWDGLKGLRLNFRLLGTPARNAT